MGAHFSYAEHLGAALKNSSNKSPRPAPTSSKTPPSRSEIAQRSSSATARSAVRWSTWVGSGCFTQLPERGLSVKASGAKNAGLAAGVELGR